MPSEPNKIFPDYFCRMPQAKDEVNKCSLKVYLAWAGTDRYDTALESSNMMFSKVRHAPSCAWHAPPLPRLLDSSPPRLRGV